MSELCKRLPAGREACFAGIDEHGTSDGAEAYCRSAADALQSIGGSMVSPTTDAGGQTQAPASCETLRQCCHQISSGPARSSCLVAVGQLVTQGNASTSCTSSLEAYVGDGSCIFAGAKGPEDSDLTCNDGVDNDENGHADCSDWNCSRNPIVTVCRIPEEDDRTCGDGLDNDSNGRIDCADPSCVRSPNVTSCRAPENTDAACRDDQDNDGDGFVDCDDHDCSRSPTITVCGVPENTNAACQDGRDNDGDQYVDCEDYDCSRNATVSVCP